MIKNILKSVRNRKINWISSTDGDQNVLNQLAEKMSSFYSTTSGRKNYQKMLDVENGMELSLGSTGHDLVKYIIQNTDKNSNILEIGCGRGNILREFRKSGQVFKYYGLEVAPHIIEMNRAEFPDDFWEVGTAYKIPHESGYFDICYSHFVLEHLIFIERALEEMMRVLKPGGKLILIFPDFVELKSLPSQCIGLSPGANAKERLKKGKFIDALISIYDSRIRIPAKLKNVFNYGPFPININPICLMHPDFVHPDVDAVYISSKEEIANWAGNNQYEFNYPFGINGQYRYQVFIVVNKGIIRDGAQVREHLFS